MNTGGGVTTDLTTAISSAGCAVGLVDLSDGTIASISNTWLDHLGLPAESVLGRPGVDLVRHDKEAAAQALSLMRDGAIHAFVARGELNEPLRAEPMSTVWVRSFELGGRHLAFVQVAPGSDDTVSPIAKQLGLEPTKMAIGTIDQDFTITALSSDITRLLGVSPSDLVGRKLLSVVARRDVSTLLTAGAGDAEHTVALSIHLRNKAGDWVELCCVLTSLAGTPERYFVLAPEPDADASQSRLAELEHHLWSIAAIVDASGVLKRVGPLGDVTGLPQANSLTSRQWEILARILRGERVPTIASDLHVSQSTVRNHLSAIFKRFGVHSQAELIRAIEDASMGPPGDRPDDLTHA
jgi:DNA-binding CsgD family transcriptional regulator